MSAFPPEGQPYLSTQVEFAWTKGAVRKELDIKLPRGILIRGKVTEEGTNRPLAGVSIQFIPHAAATATCSRARRRSSPARTTARSRSPSRPARATCSSSARPPTTSSARSADGCSTSDQPGGRRYHAHAIIPYEVKAGDPPHEVAAALRPGKTIKGRVVGPDGQTVTDAVDHHDAPHRAVQPAPGAATSSSTVRDGRFELHGLDPESSARISFLDPDHEWGATVELSGKQAGEELTDPAPALRPGQGAVRRARRQARRQADRPCSRSSPRPARADGRASTSGTRPSWRPTRTSSPTSTASTTGTARVTDAEGRITLPDLIPGALYRISDFSTVNDPRRGYQVRKDFTVKPGETLDLGDTRIARPKMQ